MTTERTHHTEAKAEQEGEEEEDILTTTTTITTEENFPLTLKYLTSYSEIPIASMQHTHTLQCEWKS